VCDSSAVTGTNRLRLQEKEDKNKKAALARGAKTTFFKGERDEVFLLVYYSNRHAKQRNKDKKQDGSCQINYLQTIPPTSTFQQKFNFFYPRRQELPTKSVATDIIAHHQ